MESSGQAAYESRASEADADDPYSVNFAITPASLQRVFSLAQRAHFFEGDFDYRKHRIAYTGTKTLSYAESGRHFESSYNWSENTAIQELTTIFQAISNTLEAGQRLAYLKRFDKLGLVRELEDMERLSAEGDLMELQTISPLLQQISSDPSVLNIARERARKLLARSPQAQAAN